MSVLEGDLRTVALQKVLENIWAMRGSGILTVQGEDDIVAISFLEGGIVAADALNQTLEEGLGKVLQSRNLLSEEDFTAVAQDHSGGASESLGELIVRRGLVSRDEYLEAFRQQTFDLMVQVLDWTRGEFKFYGGDEVSFEEGFKPILIDELLMRSVEENLERRPIDAVAEPLPELESIYGQAPTTQSVKILGEDGDGRGAGPWLTREQADFLAALDGHKTAAAVARAAGIDDYQARFTLYKLQQRQLITSVGKTEPVLLKLEEVALDEPLRAEIFRPPEPESDRFEELDEAAAGGGDLARLPLVGAALAALLAAAVVLGVLVRPGAGLLPFPWQDNHRIVLERQLRQSLLQKIDRAAKSYFLVEAHYPDSLAELVELGLLSQADLRDPSGAPIFYSTDDIGYRIELQGSKPVDEGLGISESITGDFLLDPQWLSSESRDEVPLILLD